jgi:hypothetical protein
MEAAALGDFSYDELRDLLDSELYKPSLRGANGSRECAPDDRLRDEAIHHLC